MKPLDSNLINEVIQKYYSFLPNGNSFYDTIDIKDNIHQETTLKFLIDEEILIPWGSDNKVILSKLGREIVEKHEGIENYLLAQKKREEKEHALKEAAERTIFYQEKLAKWQVKSFWYIFGLALFGGLYSLYVIIQSLIK